MPSHQLGTVTDEHLYELGLGELQECGLGLGSGWAMYQHSLGRLNAEILELFLVHHQQHYDVNQF